MLFDITRLVSRLLDGKHPTGVDRVSLAYLTHYRTQAQALIRHLGRWMMFSRGRSQRLFSLLLEDAPNAVSAIRREVGLGHLHVRPPRAGAVLFNTGHSGLDDPRYAAQVRRFGLQPFYFLHDLIPITHPEYCRQGETERHQRRILTMLETGQGLIANSADTAVALREFAVRHDKAVPPTVVAPIGTLRLPQPLPAPPLPVQRPYFVMLGTIEPRKNHLLLLHVWRRIIETCQSAGVAPEATPLLVVIGQRGWDCEQVLDLLERCPALQSGVLELPSCDDVTLSTWLHNACALLFPSFVEGFGMPLVEALAHGVPAIASDLPVFREIAGDIPDYLDPLDGPAWVRAITAYAAPQSPARVAQSQRIEAFRAPSWAQHFETVTQLLGGVRSKAQAPA